MDISVNEYIKRYTADQDYSINFFIAVSKYVLGVTNYSDTYKVTKKYGRNALSDFLSFLPQGVSDKVIAIRKQLSGESNTEIAYDKRERLWVKIFSRGVPASTFRVGNGIFSPDHYIKCVTPAIKNHARNMMRSFECRDMDRGDLISILWEHALKTYRKYIFSGFSFKRMLGAIYSALKNKVTDEVRRVKRYSDRYLDIELNQDVQEHIWERNQATQEVATCQIGFIDRIAASLKKFFRKEGTI